MSARKTAKTVETTELVVVPVEVIEKENRIVDLESEVIRLQDRIKDIRKELRGLEGKTKREGPTKMQLAVEYFNNHAGLARKEYVEAFQKELGLTLSGSRTYIQLIMKKSKIVG